MTKQKLFLKAIREHGQSATVHTETGDACPCVTNEGYYDAQWHRDNPAPGDEDCEGKLIIDTTPVNTSVKALILPKADVDEKVKEKIGTMLEDEHLFMGAYNVSTGAIVDVSGMDENHDYVLFQGDKYNLRDVDAERVADEVLYYYGILTRKTNN